MGLLSYLFKPRVGIPFLILLAVGAAYLFFFRENGDSYELAAAAVMDIRQEVSVTGRVEPVEAVDLSFEKGGRVRNVMAKTGDEVPAGAILLSLENEDLIGSRDQARAELAAAIAILEQYQKGARPEELAVSEAKLKSADASVQDAQSNIFDNISDAYLKADDAVRNKSDQFFLDPRSGSPQLSFSISNSRLESEIESGRFLLEKELWAWSSSLAVARTDVSGALAYAKNRLASVRVFLDNIALALSTVSPSGSLSQTTLDSYRADISTARTNVSTAGVNLTAAEEKFRSAETARLVAARELELLRAGKAPEEIAAQEARVRAAESKVRSADAEIGKTLIRAPFAGVVTDIRSDPGETVSAGEVVVKMLSSAGFEIESFIPEVDIAKVREGNEALVTLDAYGPDVVFPVRVRRIDPQETIVEGVATYKATFDFLSTDERVRAGMTANIEILTDMRRGVIAVPQRAVKRSGGVTYVEILDASGTTPRRVEVETGLKGSDGYVEIRSGLSGGEDVIVFSKE